MSINGYSSKENFDFEISGVKWSSIKDNFKKGEEAQKDSQALTVKRAIRLMSKDTSEYIKKTDCRVPLQKYNKHAPKHICHLGAHFVCNKEESGQILLLWEEFDKRRGTKVKDSVKRIIELRFP